MWKDMLCCRRPSLHNIWWITLWLQGTVLLYSCKTWGFCDWSWKHPMQLWPQSGKILSIMINHKSWAILKFDLERHYEVNSPTTCTKTVTVRMSNSTLKLRPRKEIIFNGDEVQHLPKLLSNNVEVLKASSLWVKGNFPINKQ